MPLLQILARLALHLVSSNFKEQQLEALVAVLDAQVEPQMDSGMDALLAEEILAPVQVVVVNRATSVPAVPTTPLWSPRAPQTS